MDFAPVLLGKPMEDLMFDLASQHSLHGNHMYLNMYLNL